MELVVGLIIVVIALIVAALALYLILTIVELRKINSGLQDVLAGVGEIVTKTAPVNGVLDAINKTLVTGRDLLEGLALKKAGGDAAGLVESCFPGEGQRFLARIGQRGTVVPIGEAYPRGEAILASLLGQPAPAAAPPPPKRISLRKSSPPAGAAQEPVAAGRLSAKGSRPWE